MRALATFPALRSVNLPAGAAIVAVHAPRTIGIPAASLLVECDPSAAKVERQFTTVLTDATVPANASFVGSYRALNGPLTAVYELVRSDVPADLPAERHEDYRLLLREGYKVTGCPTPGYPPGHSWKAPADANGNMSLGVMEAVARLQECGYGPVVD